MSHFAKVENGIVTEVIIAEQDVINSGLFGIPEQWIQTSYNTYGNSHPNNNPLRGNFAGIGFVYDSVNDVFYPQQPFNSWTLNTNTWLWDSPVPMPTNGIYKWDEPTLNWVEVTQE